MQIFFSAELISFIIDLVSNDKVGRYFYNDCEVSISNVELKINLCIKLYGLESKIEFSLYKNKRGILENLYCFLL